MILSLLLLMGMQTRTNLCAGGTCDQHSRFDEIYAISSASEPLDVPAIQFKDVRQLSDPPARDFESAWRSGQKDGCENYVGGKYDAAKRTCTVDAWTCRDKKRGLWHDEQPFPYTLYWCRKVQTGGKP